MNTNVYIATLPRSGSTLLGMMLNNHSQIFHMGESSYWGKINPAEVACSCGRIGCGILKEIQSRIAGSPEVKAIYDACSKIDRQDEPDKICHPLSLPSNDSAIAAESEINHDILLGSSGLEKLAEIFRQITGRCIIVDNTKCPRFGKSLLDRKWRVIVLTRDPRGIVNSNKNAGIRKGVPRPVATKIPILINFAQEASFLLKSSRTILIRYEDLCDRPAAELSRICDFLRIDYEAGMLNYRTDKGHTLMGNRMRFDENNCKVKVDDSWSTQLRPAEIDLIALNLRLTELYGQWGYKF